MFKKAFAALALAVIAVFAVPAAANADVYVPQGNITVSGTIVASGTVTITFTEGSFDPNVPITFQISGEGTAQLNAAAFRSAVVTETGVTDADGGAAVDVTLPAGASGTYTITATSTLNGETAIASVPLTVTAADAGTGVTNPGTGLPDTGAEVPVLALWAAGGALALGAALIAVMTIVRRQRLSQD